MLNETPRRSRSNWSSLPHSSLRWPAFTSRCRVHRTPVAEDVARGPLPVRAVAGRLFYRRSGRQRGMTLVELLVAVSVVGVLVSISLPALAVARRAAWGVHCQASHSQLGTAFTQYRSDSRELMPVCYTLADVRTGQLQPFAAVGAYLAVAPPTDGAQALEAGQPYRCKCDKDLGPAAGYSYLYAPILLCGTLIGQPPESIARSVCRSLDARPDEMLLRDWGAWHAQRRNQLRSDGAVVSGP